MSVKPIPDGFHTITPYLLVPEAAKYIEFLKQALEAQELFRMDGPNGIIAHALLRIGDSMLMLGEPRGEHTPMPCMLYLYVKNTDALYKRALKAGATSIMEPTDQFYGDRNAAVKDSVGNQWWFATHQEDVSEAELKKRAAAC